MTSARSSTALDPLVARKLASPGVALNPAESLACVVSCIRHGTEAAQGAAGKRLAVVLGNTGAGKSALINLLHGCTFAHDEEGDRMVVRRDSPLPELMAEDLRLAMRTLGRITGRVDVEDLLDIVFRDFCIGK